MQDLNLRHTNRDVKIDEEEIVTCVWDCPLKRERENDRRRRRWIVRERA